MKKAVLFTILGVLIAGIIAAAIIVFAVIPATTTYHNPQTAMIGTWEDIGHSDDYGDIGLIYTFNQDGTGIATFILPSGKSTEGFKWKLLKSKEYESSKQFTSIYLCEYTDGSGGFVTNFTSGMYMDTDKATYCPLNGVKDNGDPDYDLSTSRTIKRVK